jgi:hypothetical protein
MDRNYLEHNLVAGVYTNNDNYFKTFTENWKENYQNVALIYNIQDGKINENMERLRHKFIATGKRYWLFMDEDILLPNNEVIEIAMEYMKENDLDIITTYQTTNFELAKKVTAKNLTFEHVTWSAGYFMLVDSERAGLIPFDMNLPTSHGNLCDIAYCLDQIEKIDAQIGIAPTIIYHADSGSSPVVDVPFNINKENEQEVNKNVKKFLKTLDESMYYGNRQIEIVFLGNGKIDENETIGGHYLKCKHPKIYKDVVSRNYPNLIIMKE